MSRHPLPDEAVLVPDPRRRAVRRGVRAMLPIVGGLAPLALLVGTAAATAGQSLAQGAVATAVIYSGSPQLALAQLTAAGSGVLVVIGTAVALNVRLVAYSAGLSDRWGRGGRRPLRLLAAAVLVDPPYGLAQRDDEGVGSDTWRWRYLASGLTLWVGWMALVLVGMAIGSRLPLEHLTFVVPMVLVAIVVPMAEDAASKRAASVAALVAVAAAGLPAGTGLLVAAAAGLLVAATGAEGWW